MAISRRGREWLGRVATGLAFVVGLFFLIQLIREVGLVEIETTLRSIDGLELILLLAFPIVTFIILTLRHWLILKVLGSPVSFFVLAAFALAGTGLSNLLPGGEIVDLGTRSLLLGRSGLPTKMAVLSSVIEGFIRFTVNTILLFVVSGTLLVVGFSEPAARTPLIIGALIAVVLLGVFGVAISRGSAQWFIRMASRLGQSPEEREAVKEAQREFVEFFRSVHPLTILTFLVTAAGFFWEPIQVLIMLKFLDIPLPFWQVFGLYHALLFPRIIPIPAGIGVSEGGGALFSTLVGQSSSLGVTIGLLSRVRSLPYIILGLVILPLAGFIKIQRPENRG